MVLTISNSYIAIQFIIILFDGATAERLYTRVPNGGIKYGTQ